MAHQFVGETGGGSVPKPALNKSKNKPKASSATVQQSEVDIQSKIYAARKAAYDARINARRHMYEQSKNELNSTVDSALRQAYISHKMRQLDTPNIMNAKGINGGMAESTIAAMQNSYGNNRNILEKARIDNLSKLKSEYDMGVAEDTADFNSGISSAYSKLSSSGFSTAEIQRILKSLNLS